MSTSIKRFITCHVPVSACNFKCHYCYISQLKNNNNKIIPFIMPANEIAKKMSIEKMGGVCYFNLCGDGETMLHPELLELVSSLTSEGHFVDIITNGTISKKFDELIEMLNDSQQSRVFIKFSFHYLELKRTNLFDVFVDNVNKIKNSNISYSIELTPNDESIEYIDEIKKFSLEKFGALPHITVARNEGTEKIELLTKLERNEYKKIWSQFDSPLFDFKFSVFNQKRCEFCYAGLWSLELNLATGDYSQCYKGVVLGNISKDDEIVFRPIGKCPLPHCFNGHAFLAFGDIPEIKSPTYAEERNRICNDGSTWLKDECNEFFSTKLFDTNGELKNTKKRKYIFISKIRYFAKKIKRLIR